MSIYADARLSDLDPDQVGLVKDWVSKLQYHDLTVLGPVLVLMGPNGLGKTRAVHALNHAFSEFDRAYDDQVTELTDIPFDLRITLNTEIEIALDCMGYARAPDNVQKYINMNEILCIDDFGQKIDRPSAMHIQHILDKRLAMGQATVITTNLTPDEVSEERGRTVADRLWAGTGTHVAFEGKSKR